MGRIVGRGVPGNPRRKKSHTLIHLRTELLLGYFIAVSCNSSTWRSNSPRNFPGLYPPQIYVHLKFYQVVKGLCSGEFLCSVQSLSRVRLFVTPWTAAHQAFLSITNSWSLLKLVSIELGDAIQPSHPLLSPSPLTFKFSQHQGLLQGVRSSHQVAKVLEFQLQHHSFQ